MTARALPTRRAGATPARTAGANVRVAIGELRLPGLSVREGDRLAAAFRGELAVRLAGMPLAEGLARERLAIDRFALVPGERAEDTGRRLAVAIAGALTATRKEPRS